MSDIILRKECRVATVLGIHRAISITTRCNAPHLEQIRLMFANRLNEGILFNLDESFIIDQDNRRALGFLGEAHVNYADV